MNKSYSHLNVYGTFFKQINSARVTITNIFTIKIISRTKSIHNYKIFAKINIYFKP